MTDLKLISIGSDPEAFITRKGKVVSSIALKVLGTKKEPFKISETTSILRDNILIEWNVTPSYSALDFESNIVTSVTEISNYLKDIDPDLRLKFSDFEVVTKRMLNNKEAMTFGCSADRDAYQFGKLRDPIKPPKEPIRSAGGHIHIGTNREMSPNEMVNTALWLDYFLIPLERAVYGVSRRGELYGRPGSFRETPYGMEYRSLGNWWYTKTKYINSVYDYVCDAVSLSYKKPPKQYIDSIEIERFKAGVMPFYKPYPDYLTKKENPFMFFEEDFKINFIENEDLGFGDIEEPQLIEHNDVDEEQNNPW